MSRLLLKSVLKRHRFVLELFGVSVFLHMFILWCVLCIGRNTIDFHFKVNSSLIASDVPVIFKPLEKRILPPTSTKKMVPVPQKKNSSAVKKPATSVNTVKQPSKPAVKKKPLVKKEPVKKAEPVKPASEPKPQKASPVPKKEPEKVAPNKTNVQKNELPVKKPVEQIPQHIDVDQAASDSAIIVGQEEHDALQMQIALQEEMARVWRPPLGVSKDVYCDVAITFDWNGAVKEMVIQKPSGMPIYDTSVRQAVYQFKAPRWALGKTIHISFRQ